MFINNKIVSAEETHYILKKYHYNYSDFDEHASKEEQLIVMRYITQEANRMQRRLAGLE